MDTAARNGNAEAARRPLGQGHVTRYTLHAIHFLEYRMREHLSWTKFYQSRNQIVESPAVMQDQAVQPLYACGSYSIHTRDAMKGCLLFDTLVFCALTV